ncbi:lysozyme [Pseudoxanthomonas sp. LH2527]|uniref:lysozyme n=1 Tax=Pseudoxanthomonas sp. LH2527 TaxID=2923249 RepID=UPI001F12D331|nr:lysozyme [Pseudoxanthomonas sp. LH2527]
MLALAAGIIKPWEGREHVPYRDLVGIWTVCEGVTGKAVIPGRRYSDAECDVLLDTEIGKHYAGVSRCISRPVQVHEMAAITSWTYNVGVANACGSTLVRKINQGFPGAAWCPELLKWNKARVNGQLREVGGLTNRRKAELRVCLGDAP